MLLTAHSMWSFGAAHCRDAWVFVLTSARRRACARAKQQKQEARESEHTIQSKGEKDGGGSERCRPPAVGRMGRLAAGYTPHSQFGACMSAPAMVLAARSRRVAPVGARKAGEVEGGNDEAGHGAGGVFVYDEVREVMCDSYTI